MATPGANLVLSWVNELTDMEEQIEALQSAKRDFYASIRDQHGKPVANGLKAAMRIHRMDSEKRADAEKVDEEAARILSIIENQSHAPRATRAREIIEEFPPHDPATGEITEQQESEIDHDRNEPVTVDSPPAPTGSASDEMPEPFQPPAFLTKPRTAADYRPNCLNPDNCAASGLDHCYGCRKAMAEEAA